MCPFFFFLFCCFKQVISESKDLLLETTPQYLVFSFLSLVNVIAYLPTVFFLKPFVILSLSKLFFGHVLAS